MGTTRPWILGVHPQDMNLQEVKFHCQNILYPQNELTLMIANDDEILMMLYQYTSTNATTFSSCTVHYVLHLYHSVKRDFTEFTLLGLCHFVNLRGTSR